MIKIFATTICVFFIRIYQLAISPYLGMNCRYIPTCSEYCCEALKKFGVIKGVYITILRLLRCHPCGNYGYDPVPEKFTWMARNSKN